MANDNLKNFLALANKADEIAKNNTTVHTTPKKVLSETNYINRNNFDDKINELNEMVFGKYQKPKGEYSAEDEMERIKTRMTENVGNGKISNPILQEVFNNPYDMDIDMILNDKNPKRSQLEEKLSKKFGGIEQAKEINRTLEETDKQKINEKKQNVVENNTVAIDYSVIENIIERVIENKLNNLQINKNSLNESKGKSSPMIIIGENFTFVDTDGNMYKCEDMKYIGKMKIKSK